MKATKYYLTAIVTILWTTVSYAQLYQGQMVIENLTPSTTLSEPIDLAHAPDGRIFIAERGGTIKSYFAGAVSTITTVATVTGNEQGLLGLAVHPGFTTEGWVYVFYTNATSTYHNIDRFWVDALGTSSNHQNLFQLDPILGGFHNGGAILFHNGSLIVSSGDSQQPSQSQDLNTYRGKILRFTDTGLPAPDNPYSASASAQQRSIWATGFRNPWRIDADPISGRMFVADVGTSWEEIDEITAPSSSANYNYAWGHNQGGDGVQNDPQFIDPIYTYATGSSEGCAITNVVYFNPPSTSYPIAMNGNILYKDWCRDELRMIDPDQANPASQVLFTGLSNSALGLSVGLDGSLYYVNLYGSGNLYRINYQNNDAPAIVNHPVSTSKMEQENHVFSVTATGATPLSYQWKKDGVDISGATNQSLSITNLTNSDAGLYSVVVSNGFGSVESNGATLTVEAFNGRPNPQITSPLTSITFVGGDSIVFTGIATDPEDGPLPISSFSWELQLWHADTEQSAHWHPGTLLPSGVDEYGFLADNQGEKSPNIWFMLIMKAVDSNGLEGRDTLEIYPDLVNLTAETQPTGLEVTLSVVQDLSPVSTQAIPGTKGLLNAPLSQILNGNLYTFSHWQHGGQASQDFTVPESDSTFVAVYTESAIAQNPYGGAPHQIPGTIEAEEYDTDGEGIAYHDITLGNAGGQMRTDDVDIENSNEGPYNVGWTDPGEWLEYTASVATAGNYEVVFRLASPAGGGSFHLEVDDQDVTGSVLVGATGGWQNWDDIVYASLFLTQGSHEIRFVVEADGFNFNYIQFNLLPSNLAADFESDVTEICQGDTVRFTDHSTGSPDQWLWSFGPGATPANATGQGPHEVVFDVIGQHSASLQISLNTESDSEEKINYISVNSLPDPQWVVSPTQVGCKDTNAFMVSGGVGSSFNWLYSANATFVDLDGHGEDHDHIALSFAAKASEVLGLIETDISGCINDTLKVDIEVDCVITGTAYDLNEAMFLLPNVVDDKFYISSPETIGTYSIHDSFGKQVHNGSYTTGEAIDASALKAGWYIVDVHTPDNNYSARFVKL